MVVQEKIAVLSRKHFDLVKITGEFCRVVENSGINAGVAFAITAHTTTGITVNESLECLESDIEKFMESLVQDDGTWAHAHWLPTYGRTSANITGHLRSLVTGNHCVFPVTDGKVNVGAAQDIYLTEYDGPQNREITIVVMGE